MEHQLHVYMYMNVFMHWQNINLHITAICKMHVELRYFVDSCIYENSTITAKYNPSYIVFYSSVTACMSLHGA